MVIIGMLSFPTESSKEMGKRFMGISPLPKYITKKGPYFSSELGAGIKAISVFEFEPSKMAEANQYISNYYATYIGVSGYTYTIGTWQEAMEALNMIGMA
jgi:hypothetical protein